MSLWTMFIKHPITIYIERGEEEALEVFKDFFGEDFSKGFVWCQTGEPNEENEKNTIILGIEERKEWIQ